MNQLCPYKSSSYRTILWSLLLVFASVVQAKSSDPLPSWNNGASKSAIVQFVTSITKKSGADFLPTAERIATFDNNDTLWSEQPIAQLMFALDRVKAEATNHPEWKNTEPFKSVLANGSNVTFLDKIN